MATRFFEHQEQARKATIVLLVCMGFAVLAVAVGVYFLLIALRKIEPALVGPRHAPFLHNEPFDWWQPGFFFGTLCAVGSIMLLVTWSRFASLGSGREIAEMLGGALISPESTDPRERRLMNVVEEMAIASGVPIPQVFVLRNETGINAFAAGYGLSDAAVAVTQGGLDHLTRDELQGVIAHEFSHILNGDMRLNLRLMGIVYGIVCIATVGRMLVRWSQMFDDQDSRSSKSSGRTIVLTFGGAVFLLGAIGELFGNIIKAAVSRQREYLADASAVQFTRNPAGLAEALKKIGGLVDTSVLRTSRAAEASHIFFADAIVHRFTTIFATHPPLLRRIQRLEPSFDGPYDVVEHPTPAVDAFALAGVSSVAGVSSLAGEIGTMSPAGLHEAHRQLEAIPAPLADAANHPFSACALTYAAMLSADDNVRQRQMEIIANTSSDALARETQRLAGDVHALDRALRIPLVEKTTHSLRELTSEQQSMWYATLDALAKADATLSVFEYVVLRTLTRRVKEAHEPRRHSNRKFTSAHPLATECRLVFSVLAHSDTDDHATAYRSYAAGMKHLGLHVPALPEILAANARSLSALGPALDTIRLATAGVRQQVLEGCVQVIVADQFVSSDQSDLLRVIGDSLDLPVPILKAGNVSTVT